MKTIFKSYGMFTNQELEQYEKEVLEYCKNNEIDNPNEAEITDMMYRWVDYDYEDEEVNLNKEIDGKILCIATIGRWDGRHQGYKVLGNNLKDILWSFGCDDFHLYYDGFNIRGLGYHHDGRNSVEYREIRTDRCIDRLLDIIYSGEVITRQLLNYYTKSLRPYVKEIYGW